MNQVCIQTARSGDGADRRVAAGVLNDRLLLPGKHTAGAALRQRGGVLRLSNQLAATAAPGFGFTKYSAFP